MITIREIRDDAEALTAAGCHAAAKTLHRVADYLDSVEGAPTAPVEYAMRAKMVLASVVPGGVEGQPPSHESLRFTAVARSGGYPADGLDEDNTYARFSPSGELTLTVANPALLGKFAVGEKFYLEFIRADR